MQIYKEIIRPILFNMDPEEAHGLAQSVALATQPIWPAISGWFKYGGSDLKTTLAGVELANPVGLAAGFDKNGKLASMLGHLGFGYAEIGSVTAKASQGNPRPRLFRLPADEALINRMGLNGEGVDLVAERLAHTKFSLPVGLSIAKTNDPAITGDAVIQDVLYTFCKIKNLPLAYVAINVSCPNTKEGILEEKNRAGVIFHEFQKENNQNLPILVKLSPDGSDALIEGIVEEACKEGLAGYICGNTTTTRNDLHTPMAEIERIGSGGLSGPPLKSRALSLCRRVFKLKQPNQIIIGVGGIGSGKDAYDFIKSGASLLELYTALIYHGPTLALQINLELSELLRKDGLQLNQAVGLQVN